MPLSNGQGAVPGNAKCAVSHAPKQFDDRRRTFTSGRDRRTPFCVRSPKGGWPPGTLSRRMPFWGRWRKPLYICAVGQYVHATHARTLTQSQG